MRLAPLGRQVACKGPVEKNFEQFLRSISNVFSTFLVQKKIINAARKLLLVLLIWNKNLNRIDSRPRN